MVYGDCVIVYEILLFRLFTIVYDQDSDHVIKILYCDSLKVGLIKNSNRFSKVDFFYG